MSRTDKDVPYWVRLNNEGTSTDHDHLRLGKALTKRVYLRDENNRPYQIKRLVLARAEDVARNTRFIDFYGDDHKRLGYYGSRNVVLTQWKDPLGFFSEGHWRTPTLGNAMSLVSRRRGGEYIEVGYLEEYASEIIVTGQVADYCTEGEKIPNGEGWYRNSTLPCTPSLPAGKGWWNYGNTSTRRGEHERYYGQDRVRTRDHFRKIANAWNGGEDIEDWDENEVLTDDTWGYILW